MSTKSIETRIVEGLELRKKIRDEKLIEILNTNLFEHCNCDQCFYHDNSSKALKLIGYDSLFFRVFLFKKNDSCNYYSNLIIYKYTGNPINVTHLFSKSITIEDLLEIASDKTKEDILFNLKLFI